MAKRIRVSDDSGVTWYTLPGASGEFSTEMANVDDTIFGQSWQSESPSIGNWMVSGAAYFKGVAGYSAAVKAGGTPVAVTGEATTLVSGKTYRINAAARRFISYTAAIVVYDNAVDHTADVVSIDYLNGLITFNAGYTVTGPVTLDFTYVPTAAIAKARSFNLTQQAAEIDTTDYATAVANGGWRTYVPGLKTVGLEIGNVWAAANDFVDILAARSLIYVDVSPNNTAGHATQEVLYRGFFKYLSQNQSGNVGALEEETLNLNLFVPDGSLLVAPFRWYFGSASALSPAVQICLDAWQNDTLIDVQYSADGTVGKKGQALVTEASLANVYEGQNEFSFSFRGTGAPADI
jgi:hypothetical protein